MKNREEIKTNGLLFKNSLDLNKLTTKTRVDAIQNLTKNEQVFIGMYAQNVSKEIVDSFPKKVISKTEINNKNLMHQTNKKLTVSARKNAEDYNNLVLWIKTFLCIKHCIPNVLDTIDSLVETKAEVVCAPWFSADAYSRSDTFKEMEKIIDMGERKKRLIKVYDIFNQLFECLNKEELLLINLKFEKRITMDRIAEKFDIGIRKLYRKINGIINKLSDRAILLNLSVNNIEKIMNTEPWIMHYYKCLKRQDEIDKNKQRKKIVNGCM